MREVAEYITMKVLNDLNHFRNDLNHTSTSKCSIVLQPNRKLFHLEIVYVKLCKNLTIR